MRKNDNLVYGAIFLLLGILFVTWMKEDSFAVLGLFNLKCSTLGTVMLVIAAWNLLVEFSQNDSFSDLITGILMSPFYLLGWLLEHWYLVAGIAALVFFFGPEEDAPGQAYGAVGHPGWTMEFSREPEVRETEWVPPATNPPERVVQDYPGMSREAGICKNLREDAMLLLVFVNDNTSSWTPKEMQTFTANVVKPGMDYIVYRAAEYGYGITLDHCVYPDENGDTKALDYNGTVYDLDSSASTKDLTERAAEAYGFATVSDMIENVRQYAGNDQVGIVFCMDKAGRSYAHRHDTDPDYVEYVMLFSNWKGQKTRAAAVAHEIMHLFGADDMYAEGDVRVNRAALAKKLHPKELYYEYQWNLYDNVVGPYTAYAVGWRDTLPPEYDCPEWWT